MVPGSLDELMLLMASKQSALPVERWFVRVRGACVWDVNYVEGILVADA